MSKAARKAPAKAGFPRALAPPVQFGGASGRHSQRHLCTPRIVGKGCREYWEGCFSAMKKGLGAPGTSWMG